MLSRFSLSQGALTPLVISELSWQKCHAVLFLFLAVYLKVCSHDWLPLSYLGRNDMPYCFSFLLSISKCVDMLCCVSFSLSISRCVPTTGYLLSYLGSNDMLCCFYFSLSVSRCILNTGYIWVILTVMTCCAVSLSCCLSQGVFTPLVISELYWK